MSSDGARTTSLLSLLFSPDTALNTAPERRERDCREGRHFRGRLGRRRPRQRAVSPCPAPVKWRTSGSGHWVSLLRTASAARTVCVWAAETGGSCCSFRRHQRRLLVSAGRLGGASWSAECVPAGPPCDGEHAATVETRAACRRPVLLARPSLTRPSLCLSAGHRAGDSRRVRGV